jgi:hypothetical protein
VARDIADTRNLNPLRPHRSYPRVVKRARHNHYPVKRATDIGIRHDRPPTIRLVNLEPTPKLRSSWTHDRPSAL